MQIDITYKKRFLDEWVSRQNDADLRAGWVEGLICVDEVLALLKASVLDPIAPDVEITYTLCASSRCECGCAGARCLPRAVYSAWRALRAKLPAGSTCSFRRVRACRGEGEEPTPQFYVVVISVPCGPFTFEREVRLSTEGD